LTQDELKKLLDELRALPVETEWIEFKEAKNTFHFDEIGKYFSALSNEANLKGKDCGWLIFGIEHRSKKIVNTRFRINKADLDILTRESTGSTALGIKASKLKAISIIVPPIKKQIEICNLLNREVSKFDRIEFKIQSQIEILKEYRQALISNVVTGKVITGRGNILKKKKLRFIIN